MNEFGEPIEKPVPMPVKMEELLRTALGRRDKYTQAKRDFTTPGAFAWNRKFFLPNGRMTDEDMKVIFNDWRHDVGAWMRPA